MTPMPIAYPNELDDVIALPNAVRLRIRALRRCDEGPIRELDAHVSVRSRHLRFLSPLRTLPDPLVRLLACVDYQRSLALVAEQDGSEPRDILGLASFAAIDDRTAELGLLVRDDWQRQRIGTALATRIVAAAEDRGFHRFVVHMFSDNVGIRRVIQTVGEIVATTVRGNVCEVTFVARGSMLRRAAAATRRG